MFFRLIKLLCLILTLLSSCRAKFDVSVKRPPYHGREKDSAKFLERSVSGRILPLTAIAEQRLTNPSCDPPQVHIHRLTPEGTIDIEPRASTTVTPAGDFLFEELPNAEVILNEDEIHVQYILRAIICDKVYVRPLLGSSNQDLGYHSTLLSFALTGGKSKVAAERKKIAQLIPEDEVGTTFEETFLNLEQQADWIENFQQIFTMPPDELKTLAPMIGKIQVVAQTLEGQAVALQATAFHWWPPYNQQIAYQWQVDNTILSNHNNATYYPTANDQGLKAISLHIGRRQEKSGTIDNNLVMTAHHFTLEVLNSSPPVPPLLSSATTFISDDVVELNLQTGEGFSACDSFSKMALTENQPQMPKTSAFNLSCTSPGEQVLRYNFKDKSDGNKTLRLWAMDASGTISHDPRILELVKDTTPPSISITGIAARTRGGSQATLSVAIAEATSGIHTWELAFSEDGVVYTSISFSREDDQITWLVPENLDTADARLKITVVDNAGLTTTAISPAFAIDSTPPIAPVTVALASAPITNQVTTTINITDCQGASHILINESATLPASDDNAWINCGTGQKTYHPAVSTEGSRQIRIWSKDEVGNQQSTPATVHFIYDITAPVINLTALNGAYAGGSSPTLSWQMTEANAASSQSFTVEVYDGSGWVSLGTRAAADGPITSQTFTKTDSVLPTVDTSAAKIRIKFSDLAGNEAVATMSGTFIIDSTPPYLMAGEMSLNDGSSATVSNFVRIALAGSDNRKITHFCLKYNHNTQPAAKDACWRSVAANPPGLIPAASLLMNDYYMTLGFTPGTFTVYAWLKDEAGNMSTLSGSGGTVGKDKASITYTPGTPAVIVDFYATNTDTPSQPVALNEMSIAAGNPVYIKWKANDDDGLPDSLKLSYSTDDKNWATIASGLSNGANGGCALTGAATGCYVWTSPINSYYRLKLSITDAQSMVSQASSNAINVSSIKFLAGNTETGLGGSGRAMAMPYVMYNSATPEFNTFAVAGNGDIYYRNPYLGIIRIEATTGLSSLLIPTTGTASGDDGPVESATLRLPVRIAIDHQDRLLIWDYNRIRRVDTRVQPMSINTLIGGGAITNPVGPTNALDLSLGSRTLYTGAHPVFMVPLPNGDLFFQRGVFEAFPSTGFHIAHYHAATGLVSSHTPGGIGAPAYPNQDLSNLLFKSTLGAFYDVETSVVSNYALYISSVGTINVSAATIFDTSYISSGPFPAVTSYIMPITGLDGKVYGLSVYAPRIYKYDLQLRTWQPIAGTGTRGQCNDGTNALSCQMDPVDLFVNKEGVVFFLDRGAIRTIREDGTILTLAGQRLNFGDGGQPLSARFNLPLRMQVGNGGSVAIFDQSEIRIRKFDGQQIVTLAGNGNDLAPAAGSVAATSPLKLSSAGMFYNEFALDPVNGDIFFNRGRRLAKLSHATGKWTDISLFDSGTPYYNAEDGTLGANTAIGNYYPRALGFGGSQVLAYLMDYNTTPPAALSNAMLKLFDKDTGAIKHLVGKQGALNALCPVGTALNQCTIDNSVYLVHYNSDEDEWLLSYNGFNSIRRLAAGDSMQQLTGTSQALRAFTYHHDGSNPYVYYCSTASNKIRKRSVTTGVETELAWPVGAMQCAGHSMHYKTDTNSIVFIYTLHGLYGVAEHLQP